MLNSDERAFWKEAYLTALRGIVQNDSKQVRLVGTDFRRIDNACTKIADAAARSYNVASNAR